MSDTETMLEEFGRRAAALGVRVDRVPDSAAAASTVQGTATDARVTRLVVSGEVRRRAPGLIQSIEASLDVETATDPAAVRDAPLALTLAHTAYAETGSVLLAEPDLPDRAVGMLSGTLVVVLPTGGLRAGLEDAVAGLRAIASQPGGGYATLMTGPSRTADIERVLTVGVQGPGKVVVVFVDHLL